MWYLALFAACIIVGLTGIIGGAWLFQKITTSGADYLPHDWDFETYKEAEGR